MTSLLPPPYGAGTRNNFSKRYYVLDNINQLFYRTIATNIDEAISIENYLKQLKIHIFNT